MDKDKYLEEEETPWWSQARVLIPAGVVVLILIGVAVLLILNANPAGLTFSVDFQKADGIGKDSPVIWQGVPVGKVLDTSLTANNSAIRINVEIQPKYTDGMRTGSVFTLISNPTSQDATRRAVQIETVVPTSPNIKPDDVYKGANDILEAISQTAQLAAPDLVDKYLRLGEYRIVTTIDGNQISRSFMLESGLMIPQTLLMVDILPSGASWTKANSTTDRTNIIKIGGIFTDIKEAQWSKSTLQVSNEPALFWTDYTVSETFKQGQFLTPPSGASTDTQSLTFLGQLGACVAQPASCPSLLVNCANDVGACINNFIDVASKAFGPLPSTWDTAKSIPLQTLSIQYTFNMPGTIIDTNAPEFNGGSAYWSITGETLNNGVTLSAKSRQLNFLAIIIAALLLIGLAVGAFLFIRRRYS